MDYLTSAASGKETPAAIMAANYLDAQARKTDPNSWKTWKNYKPYEIREFDGVKAVSYTHLYFRGGTHSGGRFRSGDSPAAADIQRGKAVGGGGEILRYFL